MSVYMCVCVYVYIFFFFLKKNLLDFCLSWKLWLFVHWYQSASIGLSPTIISAMKHGTDKAAEGYAHWLNTEIQSKAAVSFTVLGKNEVK